MAHFFLLNQFTSKKGPCPKNAPLTLGLGTDFPLATPLFLWYDLDFSTHFWFRVPTKLFSQLYIVINIQIYTLERLFLSLSYVYGIVTLRSP